MKLFRILAVCITIAGLSACGSQYIPAKDAAADAPLQTVSASPTPSPTPSEENVMEAEGTPCPLAGDTANEGIASLPLVCNLVNGFLIWEFQDNGNGPPTTTAPATPCPSLGATVQGDDDATLICTNVNGVYLWQIEGS